MYATTTGTGECVNSTAENKVILAAPGAGKVLRILSGVITVTLAATGGGGKVALEDGEDGTRFIEADAANLKSIPFDFGPAGYPLTANTALNMTVDEATTNEATATCTVTAYKVG
jgi:hypothetical protein